MQKPAAELDGGGGDVVGVSSHLYYGVQGGREVHGYVRKEVRCFMLRCICVSMTVKLFYVAVHPVYASIFCEGTDTLSRRRTMYCAGTAFRSYILKPGRRRERNN